jgi:ParB/RepB/Spo0J family partition protein
MNAPESIAPPPGASLVPTLPISQIAPSLTNRKHTDQDYLAGLAATIKSHGVIQPITVRPWPASRPPIDGVVYELVVGEGRWLASKIAGLEAIPAFWRELPDKEALELQLIENVKRKDISELDEATTYRRLINEHGHTADTIAAQIKKSRSYIYLRMKLLDLCPAALKIARDHNLDASNMMLAARIPDEKLQIAAIKEMAPRYAGDDPMSYRRAHDMVQQRYMLKLAEAPFSRTDAELLPAAGTCAACPKRTGNNVDLFTDVTNTDMCTDPGCFDAKKTAHVARQRAQAKANNIKVIDGAEAKKIKPNSYNDDLAGGYIDLDRKMYSDSKNRTVRQILGKDAPVEALLIDPHNKGHVIEVVSTATIKEKLAAKGAAVPNEVARRGKSDAEKEAERKRKQEGIFRQRLFDSTRGAIAVSFDTREEDSVLDLREFRQIADSLIHGMQFEEQKRLARLWIGPTEKTDDHELVRQLKKRIETMERKDCARLMLEASLVGEISAPTYGDHPPANLLATADALDIDAAAIKKGVISEMREKAKPKKAAPKVKPAAAKVQPETALPADEPLQIGDRVRVNEHLNNNLNFVGKTGEVIGHLGEAFMVTFKKTEFVKANKTNTVSFVRSELDKLPALGAKPASTPSDAAHASKVDASPAAPAKEPKAAKKPKVKSTPAPALPANEAAAPPKASAMPAWPFPT